MSIQRKIKDAKERRAERVRWRIKRETTGPRVTVFRSLNYIYGQLLDNGKTVAASSTLAMKKVKGDKKQQARLAGKELAKQALEKGITAVCFDRGRFLYHGRVKEFAEGLREGGLKI